MASSTVEIEVEDLNVAGVFNLDGLPPGFGGSRVFGVRVCVWTALQVSDLVVLFLKSCKNYYSSLSTCVSHFVATCYHILYSFDIFRSKAPAMKLAKQFLFVPFLHPIKVFTVAGLSVRFQPMFLPPRTMCAALRARATPTLRIWNTPASVACQLLRTWTQWPLEKQVNSQGVLIW